MMSLLCPLTAPIAALTPMPLGPAHVCEIGRKGLK